MSAPPSGRSLHLLAPDNLPARSRTYPATPSDGDKRASAAKTPDPTPTPAA